MKTCVKEFEVEEGSTVAMWYQIKVSFRGQIVDAFLYPTMREAQEAFKRAGYK